MTVEQFLKRFPAALTAETTGTDTACPKCGSRNITLNKPRANLAVCDDCKHAGPIKDFTVEGLEDEIEDQELRKCTRCGEPNDNGEGWNGLCGNCADKADPVDP